MTVGEKKTQTDLLIIQSMCHKWRTVSPWCLWSFPWNWSGATDVLNKSMPRLARKKNGISLCGLPTEHTAFPSIFREATEAQSPPFTIQLNLLTGTRSLPARLVISGHLSLPEAVSGLQQAQCYTSLQTNGDNHGLCKFFPWGCFLFHRPACIACFIFLIHFCSSLSHTVPHMFLWVGVSGHRSQWFPALAPQKPWTASTSVPSFPDHKVNMTIAPTSQVSCETKV